MKLKSSLLPHEKLDCDFNSAFSQDPEYIQANKRLNDAYMDFDFDGSQENASKILAALTNLEVARAKIRYAIVNVNDLKPADHFLFKKRDT